MSLDWNTKDCPGNGVTAGWIPRPEEKVGPDDRECFIHPATNSLSWGAFCGFHVGVIDTKTIDEVIWRIEFLKRINKPWMSNGAFPTPEDLDNHLGFRTNCDTKTRKQWLAFITKCLDDEVSRIVTKMYADEERVHAVNT